MNRYVLGYAFSMIIGNRCDGITQERRWFCKRLDMYFRSLCCAREMSTLMSTNKYAFTSQKHRVTINLFTVLGRYGVPTSSSATTVGLW